MASADCDWPWTQRPPTAPLLVIGSPLNAVFAGGISWEDAEWQ